MVSEDKSLAKVIMPVTQSVGGRMELYMDMLKESQIEQVMKVYLKMTS